MAVVETNGIADRVLYAQVMANLKQAYANYGVGNGNYPNVDNILTDRGLWNVWMRNNLNARIFVDGLGVTSRTAEAKGVSSVRVPLMAPPRYAPRTITIGATPGGFVAGTPGNDGLENRNLPNVPQTNGVEIYFNQVYDDACVIYELSQDMVSLPIAAEFTSQIPNAVANMEDTTIMATQIKAGLYQATQKNNANIVSVDLTNTNDGYLQGIMNQIIGLMTNPATTWAEGIVQYDLEKSVIIMRQSLFNALFTVKNGVLINGGNLPQEMLVRGAFTEDGRPKGNLIRGMYSGVYIKVVPDVYWRQAAAYAGISASQFAQWDKVLAYIANAEGTGFGLASTTINPIPNPGNGVGTKIQNLWRWGAQVIRPSSIGLVVSGALSSFINPVDTNGNIIAPTDFDAVISSYGVSTNYGTAMNVGVYDSDNQTTVTLTLNNGATTPVSISNASLEILSNGKAIEYTNGANGTYTFMIGRNEAASINVTAAGYKPQTIAIEATDTTSATLAKAVSLTAK